jgi:hypothetical protein
LLNERISSKYYIYGDPVVARNADGRLEVFVLYGEEHIWNREAQVKLGRSYQYPDNGILKWSILWPIGDKLWSPRKRPAVALNSDGLLEVFMIDSKGMLYHTWQTKQNVNGLVGPSGPSALWQLVWYQLGTRTWPQGSNPSIARNTDGKIELFIRDSDGKYYHQLQTSKNSNGTWDWSEWEVMPNDTIFDPTINIIQKS